MSTRLHDELVGDLDGVCAEWGTVSSNVGNDVTRLNSYYGNLQNKNRNDVIEQAKNDSEKMNRHYSKFQDISTRANNTTRDLNEQVISSEDSEQRMKKHGPKVLSGFILLVGAAAIGFGVKRVTAVLDGVVVGVIAVALVIAACVLFLVLRRRAIRRAKMWKEAQVENKQGLGLAKVIEGKRRLINEIADNLSDIKQDNFDSAVQAVIEANNEFLA